MPASSEEAKARKRERINERRREKRADPVYRDAERQRDRERKIEERSIERTYRHRYIDEALSHFVDDWDVYKWTDGYIAKRDGNEAYRPWLEALHESDRKKGVVRLAVYETTPLDIETRQLMPRVWQTPQMATIQVPGLPLIKRFKIFDHLDPNPIPIGEGELVRKWVLAQSKSRFIFPKSKYPKVTTAPKFFVPEAETDLINLDVEYVDIARCYSQLLGRLPSMGIQFDYGRRLFLPIDHLPPHEPSLLISKHWGRATVGMMSQTHGRIFRYGEPFSFPNRFYHGDTVNWIHGILHAMASYAISQCGCFRWHTDGGFFPEGGGFKFAKLLTSLGISHTVEEYAAVVFANLDQYEAVARDGTVKQTKLFTSTYVSDCVFLPVEQGGSQRNNVIMGLNSAWLFDTLEKLP